MTTPPDLLAATLRTAAAFADPASSPEDREEWYAHFDRIAAAHDAPVRAAAVAALARLALHEDCMIPLLGRFLASRDGYEPAGRDGPGGWRSVAEETADLLAGLGARAIPSLVAALSRPEESARVLAADALARIGAPAAVRAVPALSRLLADDSAMVRWAARDALARLTTDGG
jgi:HEAT repeat protein